MELDEQIKQLRQQNRFLMMITLFAFLMALGVVGWYTFDRLVPGTAPEPPGTIEATRFVLVDGDGLPRVVLGMANNNPTLVFQEPNQRVRFVIAVTPEASELALYEPSGRHAILGVNEGGGQGLVLKDQHHNLAGLVATGGDTSLFLNGAQDRQRIELGVHRNNPALVLRDASWNERVEIGIGKLGDASIVLHDKSAKNRVVVTAHENRGALFVEDEPGRARVLIGVEEGGPLIRLTDPAGDTLFVEPPGVKPAQGTGSTEQGTPNTTDAPK